MRPFCLFAVFFALLQATRPIQAQQNTRAEALTGLQGFVDRGELAGGVYLVANRDKILSHGAVGFADVGAKKAMQPDQLVWIASHPSRSPLPR